MKIIDYYIFETTITLAADEVREAIAEGWQPIGNAQYFPAETPNDPALVIVTMVKYE